MVEISGNFRKKSYYDYTKIAEISRENKEAGE